MSVISSRYRVMVDPEAPSYRWWLLFVTSLGALLASLASGTLIIALPDILRDLRTDIFSLLWIVVGYTLVTTVLVLNAGRLADRYGRARTYVYGFVIFTLASVFCGVAPDALLLILGRIAQGIGGAFILANSAALVADVFPRRELGRALGINAMVVGAGLILGPILGGWLTSFGWRLVFWFNVPIGIIGIVAAAAILVDLRLEHLVDRRRVCPLRGLRAAALDGGGTRPRSTDRPGPVA
jgi:multidrug resistance protein